MKKMTAAQRSSVRQAVLWGISALCFAGLGDFGWTTIAIFFAAWSARDASLPPAVGSEKT